MKHIQNDNLRLTRCPAILLSKIRYLNIPFHSSIFYLVTFHLLGINYNILSIIHRNKLNED